MKSIYLDDALHQKLKFFAALQKCSLTEVVSAFLSKDLKEAFDDLPTASLQQLSMMSGSFDFLKNPAEDIYSEDDGVPL